MSAIRPHVALATLRAFLDIFLASVGNRFGLLGPKISTLLVSAAETSLGAFWAPPLALPAVGILYELSKLGSDARRSASS
jgi:hypothetical protein